MSKTSKSIKKLGQGDKGLCVPYVQYVCVVYFDTSSVHFTQQKVCTDLIDMSKESMLFYPTFVLYY